LYSCYEKLRAALVTPASCVPKSMS